MAGHGQRRPVSRVTADTKTFYAERFEGANERLVLWTEEVNALCVRQYVPHFKTQSAEIIRDGNALSLCINRDGDWRLRKRCGCQQTQSTDVTGAQCHRREAMRGALQSQKNGLCPPAYLGWPP